MRALLLVFVAACAAPVGTSGAVSAPHDSASRCGGICHDIGLTLDSVVVMANNVGCVCGVAPVPAGPPASTPANGPSAHAGAAAGGMAAILMLEAEQQQQHQNAH